MDRLGFAALVLLYQYECMSRLLYVKKLTILVIGILANLWLLEVEVMFLYHLLLKEEPGRHVSLRKGLNVSIVSITLLFYEPQCISGVALMKDGVLNACGYFYGIFLKNERNLYEFSLHLLDDCHIIKKMKEIALEYENQHSIYQYFGKNLPH